MKDESRRGSCGAPRPSFFLRFILRPSAFILGFPMLLFPSARFQKRHMNVQRTPPAPPTPVALAMIAAADVTPGPDELTFTAVFNTSADAPLASIDAADALKWTARFDGRRFEGNTLTLISPTSIVVDMAFVEDEAGPDEVNYANAPSDIADTLGRHLAAFAGFPL